MTAGLQQETQDLKNRVLSLADQVEQTLDEAVSSVMNNDLQLAQRIISSDRKVDAAEVEIEEECLRLLEVYQPESIDLRLIITVLKINNDLERVGDLAVNIAERALFLAKKEKKHAIDFSDMAYKVKRMLKNSLEAFVQMDPTIAHAVCAADDEIDDINREMYRTVKAAIRQEPEDINTWISLLTVSRCLERIADLATNLAEDIIYLINGRIIRHAPDEKQS